MDNEKSKLEAPQPKQAEKEVNKISSNLPVICSVCKAELDEKGECYYCLRQWAMLWSG